MADPMKSILDRSFKYVPAASTDIAATFRRIRREQAVAKAAQEAEIAASNVKPIQRKKG